METCPSTFALDDLELHAGAPDGAVARHVATCGRCASRRASRDADAARFRAQFEAPLWNRVAAAATPRPRRWRLAWLAPALAAVALVALVARPRTPEPDRYVGAKGERGIEVRARRAGRIIPVVPAGIGAGAGATEVRAGDELELSVRAARPEQTFVLVGSIDGRGAFSSLYPAPSRDARSVPLPPAGRPLAPPAILDDAPGPERLLVVRSTRPLAVDAIAARARAAAASRARFEIPEDPGADVRWIVLLKGAP